jgi:hypothetical protein
MAYPPTNEETRFGDKKRVEKKRCPNTFNSFEQASASFTAAAILIPLKLLHIFFRNIFNLLRRMAA